MNSPVWTPDSVRILFHWTGESRRRLYWVPADASGPTEALGSDDRRTGGDNTVDYPKTVTPDEQTLIFSRTWSGGRQELWAVPLKGDQTPVAFGRRRVLPWRNNALSNGAWQAYHFNQSGQPEVYVQPYPGPRPTVPVSIGGGGHPVWSVHGSEVFHNSPEEVLMSVAVGLDGDHARTSQSFWQRL